MNEKDKSDLLPRIAITIGDPNGIGPEVLTKALTTPEIRNLAHFVIIGSHRSMGHYGSHFLCDSIEANDQLDSPLDSAVRIYDPGVDSSFTPMPGQMCHNAGRVAGQCLEAATKLALSGKIDAVVTAPVAKAALNAAGYRYAGQTEFLTEKSNSRQTAMILMRNQFRVGLITNHCAVSEVSERITKELIVSKLIVLNSDLRKRFSITKPRIAVCALNPHAGENGLFGREEKEVIMPALESARVHGIDGYGPFPADTLFVRVQEEGYDLYVAMYHDQGLIPLKMSSFGKAVNYTAGLPFIRTSPDHGTAFDIAGMDKANPASMMEAIKVAAKLAKRRN